MKKQLIRILISLFISAGVWAGTNYWYQKNKISNQKPKGEKPIAYARNVTEDVHRRPSDRILWQLIGEGEAIYSGETIRTSEKAGMQVAFVDSEQVIHVEEDTQIVISRNDQKGLNLELLEGSLFVTPSATAEIVAGKEIAPVEVKAAGKTFDLGKSTAQISKTSTAVSVQVSSGTVKQLDESGAEKKIDSNTNASKIEIVSPIQAAPFYYNPELRNPVIFEWKGIETTSLVTLQIGKTKNALNLEKTTLEEKQTSLSYLLGPGKYYWQLVAKDPNTGVVKVKSSIYRLEVNERYPPQAKLPKNNAVYIKNGNQNPEVQFSWEKPDNAISTVLVYANDPEGKKGANKKLLVSDSSFKSSFSEGEYYWHLEANYDSKEGSKAVNSKTYKFTVTSKQEPPKPQILVSWLNPLDRSPQYFVDEPKIKLNWRSDQSNQVKFWRVKISDNEALIANPDLTEGVESFTTNNMTFEKVMKKPGRYVASVEALDEKEAVLARTPQALPVMIEKRPLAKDPILIPESGDLKDDRSGKVTLTWQPTPNAKEYQILIWTTGPDGKRKDWEFKTKGTSYHISELQPGKYKVAVKAVDEFNRQSESRSPRDLNVANVSATSAPKVRIGQ